MIHLYSRADEVVGVARQGHLLVVIYEDGDLRYINPREVNQRLKAMKFEHYRTYQAVISLAYHLGPDLIEDLLAWGEAALAERKKRRERAYSAALRPDQANLEKYHRFQFGRYYS